MLAVALTCVAIAATYVARGRGELFDLPKWFWKLLFAVTFGCCAGLWADNLLIAAGCTVGAFVSNMVPYGYYRAMGLPTGNTDNWLYIPEQNYGWCFVAMAYTGLLCGFCLFACYNPILALPMILIEPLAYSVRRGNLIVGDTIRGVCLGLLLAYDASF